jgi:quinoprotein glucose dehydrogenase
VTTGKPRWQFQAVRKDVWDYDLGAQATLVDYPEGCGSVPALVLPSASRATSIFSTAGPGSR